MIGPRAARLTLALWLLATHASAQAGKASVYSPPQQLRNYALSVCLANAFPNSPEGKDAAAAAAGYLELGTGPLDAYGAIVQLAREFLARPYAGQANVSFQTMKCIDLYNSPDLTRLVRKYTTKPGKRPPG